MSEQEAIEMLDSFYEMDEMYISAQMGIKSLKKQLKHCKNPMEVKAINQQLAKAMKERKKEKQNEKVNQKNT